MCVKLCLDEWVCGENLIEREKEREVVERKGENENDMKKGTFGSL